MVNKADLLKLAYNACPQGMDFFHDATVALKGTDFIEKSASIIDDTIKQINANPTLSKQAGMAGDVAKGVGTAALSGVAVAMLNDLVTGAHHSLTRERNFKKMLQYAPDLKDHEDPKTVKGIFDSLHALAGPKITSEPHVAAEFVRTQSALVGAGGGFSNAKNISDLVGSRVNIERNRGPISTPNIKQ